MSPSLRIAVLACAALYSAGSPAARATDATPLLIDVATDANGVLRGRLHRTEATHGEAMPRELWVEPLSSGPGLTSLRTAVGPMGRFAVAGLRPGMYRVFVERPGPSTSVGFRLWSSASAPPAAVGELVLSETTVRGQGGLTMPALTLRQAALYSGILAGAIATPIIYHNAREANRLPASP